MADDDDTDRGFDKPLPVAAADALYQSLAAVQGECEQLELAMLSRDAERATCAAEAAVAFLIAAKASHRRFDLGRRADFVLAHVAAGAAHRALNDQLLRAEVEIPSAELRRVLRRLRLSLVLAYGEPPLRQ